MKVTTLFTPHKDHGLVAIDFGGSNARVAVYVQDHVEYIPNKLGNYETPTCIAIISSSEEKKRILIGEEALEYSLMEDPHCVFWDLKQFIGKTFSDEELISLQTSWPFRIIGKQDKTIRLSICNEESHEEISVTEMIGLILKQLKEDAERYLNDNVKELVISIPNYYSNCQRIAMKKAAEKIGISYVRLIQDTSAALFQYIWKYRGEKRLFVFDLGRSGCSASVYFVDDGVIDTKSSDGLPSVGGLLLDESLVNYCCEEFYKIFKKHLRENPVSMRRLFCECEEAKKKLSYVLETKIYLKSLMDGIDFEISITRATFEKLNEPFFNKCMDLTETVLNRSNYTKSEIKDIIIVGGGSEIPKLKQLMALFFGKSIHPKPIYCNPVVFGTAIQGGILSNFEKELLLIEVTSRSIGCEVKGGDLSLIVPIDSSMPNSKVQEFLLPNGKERAEIQVYEGDCKKASDNRLIGVVNLSGLERVTGGSISLKFEMDTDGILSVIPNSQKFKCEFANVTDQ